MVQDGWRTEHRLIPGYQIGAPLSRDYSWNLFRAERIQDREPVLIRATRSQSPEPYHVDQLVNEFDILRDLDINGVLAAHDLITDSDGASLIMQDPGGSLLSEILQTGRLEIGDFLDIAKRLTATLAELHQRGIAHTQLRPDLVFVDRKGHGCWLSGFYHTVNLNAEGQARNLPAEGILTYIAPEQTGRIDAEIDHRTDLYLLGILFYEMLTGKPPFDAEDSLELIHAHLARTPMSPGSVDSTIPEPLSNIVMRLLMKKPADRYKGAHGLLADLGECESQYRSGGEISAFKLARYDRPERFEIPERLYGRSDELKQLFGVFGEVRQGGSKLILVAGYSGVGKTSLIRHIRGSVVENQAYFVSGKYDQLERSNPYSAILQAFLELVKQILTEADADIEQWKHRILAALGVNAQIVVEVIPELELIIGPQPPVPELKPVESQNRFNFYFQKFIAALARPERPLVLFLDDLQWASFASMRLFQSWVTGINVDGLLMIGAYRDNEVDASHPLRSVIRELRESGDKLTEIDLQPLGVDSINSIVQDSLDGRAEELLPLANCVHQKTHGNPFFARSFLRSLYEEGLLYFDHEEARWNWDVEAIESVTAADNVVDIMARKIERLPRETQDVIQLAACIGNRFALTTLATACGESADNTLRQLEQLISDGLIERQDDQFLRFYHDRVQEAAYGMIIGSRREKIHYQIGSLLQASVNQTELDEQIFEIVNHLNLGSALIRDAAERGRLAELNLRAGLKAKSSTAFGSAYDYFNQGIEMLPSKPWNRRYQLSFDLHRERAETAYLSGRFDEAEQGFSLLMEKARSKREQGLIYNLRIIQYENLSRFVDAAALGREAVALFGIYFPDLEDEKMARVDQEIEAIHEMLAGKPIPELVHLPLMQDADVKICMKLLMTMWAPNYISGDIAMTMLIAACMVRLSLEYGNAEESAYGYVTHGINVAARTDDHSAAYEYGQLALNVNRVLDDRSARAKVNHMFSCYIGPWREPIDDCFKYSRAGYEAGIESGDFTYGGYSGFHESWHALFGGMGLDRYAEEYSAKLQFLSGYQYQSIADAHQLMLQWGRCLQGKTYAPTSLDGDGFSEQSYLDAYRELPFFIAFYYVAKLNISYLMQDYEAASRYAEQADGVIFGVRGMIWDAWLCFYHALALAAVCDSLEPDARAAARDKIESLAGRMRVWADNAPQNFAQLYELIQAEITRLDRSKGEAAARYEQAIALAREHGFVNIEALAGQLAGQFWLQRGRQSIAGAYLRDGVGRYRQWGAHGPAAQLEQRYHDLIGMPEAQTTGVSEASPGSIDVAAILKASQAISGEMIMQQLVERLMRIVLEDAGAERGLLLFPDAHGWRVDAIGSVDDGDILLTTSLADGGPQTWSPGAVNYVSHTCEYLLCGDAQQDHRLAGDHYVREQSIKSLLCVPILQQQEMMAMLYLENNLITDAFTRDRVLVVQALAAQAAIALKNARLYSDVVKEIRERRQAESALRAIASGTASVTGGDFFQSLVQSLAASLQVKCIFVAECIDPEYRRVRTLAYMRDGKFEDNIEYEISGTPCETVVQGNACYYPDNLEKLFPREQGYESYLGAPARDLAGRVLGHLAVLDTTDMRHLPHAESILQIFATRVGVELHRKRTQEALQASEEKYRLLVENQTDLVIKLDREGCLQFVSPSYCEMFSRSETELQGSSFHQQVHPGDRARIKDEWSQLGIVPWTAQLEHRVVTAAGERWLGWALKAVPDDSGEVVEIVGVGRDVTDRRQAEEQARQHLQILAHAGRLHSMGEMASTMAHELNQPLTAILSFSQASLRVIDNRDYDRDELRNALQRIVANAGRAGEIIRHMRGFIRKEEPRSEPSNINRLVRESIELVNHELLQREIEVEFKQQDSLPEVTVDPIHIQQVILNLVRNSMEAIEQAGGEERRITITTRIHRPGSVEFSITDTGPGLDAAISDKIFNTFATTKPEGMGVGLSICKSIIEAHGGELAIRQKPGTGVTFSFVLTTASP